MTDYVIRGGAAGKARLRVIAGALRESTAQFLRQAGAVPGITALDLGCGGGDVSVQMTHLVGEEGRVVGIDMDAEKLRLARLDARRAQLYNLTYRRLDAREFAEDAVYDLVYSRFLLTHLADPQRLVERMAQATRIDGVVAVADIDYSGIVCHPHSPALQRHVALYRELVRRRGGDADIGPRLPALLQSAGLRDVQVQLVQPMFIRGDAKFIFAITTENIADALVAEDLCTAGEIAELIDQLLDFARDPHTVLSFPRIVQTWGTR